MLKVTNVLCFILIHYIYLTNSEDPEDEYQGEPLLLTPLIKENRLKEARDAAEVVLPGAEHISSYSGYITVDEEQKSNLFFWFFKSFHKASTDPVLLWLEGGAPNSCLDSIFIAHGPFQVLRGNKLTVREHTWVRTHSIIYVDSPVGNGVSFTEDGYSNTTTEIAEHLYTLLLQFFKLFPEFRENKFFIAGKTFDGKYIPELARIISERNEVESVKINLKGMAINNPISDPINQIETGDYLYELGVIDAEQRSEFQKIEQKIINSIAAGNDSNFLLRLSTMYGMIRTYSRMPSQENILFTNDNLDYEIAYYKTFISDPNITRALHITIGQSDEVKALVNLAYDYAMSVASTVDLLLEKYRIMFYTGQLSTFPNVASVNKFIKKMNYYNNTKKHQSLYIDNQFVGPYTVVGNLLNLVVRGAGKGIAYEKPKWAHEIMTKFTRNTFGSDY